MVAEIGAPFLDLLLGHDAGEVEGDHLHEGRVGLGELDLDRIGIDHRHARQGVGLAALNIVKALDRLEEARTGALRLRVGHPVEGVFHVIGGELAAVGELDAVAKLEGVGQAVRRDFVGLGEVGRQLGRARLVVHEPAEQAFQRRPVLPVVADRRIERAEVVLVGDGHLATLLDVRGEGRRRARRLRAPPLRQEGFFSFSSSP